MNDQVKLIAHRGDVSKGVENSLEALEAAAKGKAAYAEMDILLTKDHQFVVMHDYNLKRLAGVDKDVKDMTLAEVQGLKIQQDGHTSHIPVSYTHLDVYKRQLLQTLRIRWPW